MYLALKFVLNKNQSGCLTTCFNVTLAPPFEGKASSTLMFHNGISLKLVVETNMGKATSVDNGKNILEVPI